MFSRLFALALLAAATPEFDSLTKFYEAGLARNGIAGSALVLMRDGEPVYSHYYGLARQSTGQRVDADTAFHWASITKTFTGIAIMQLRDRGRLSLDDPAVKYVPELRDVHGPVEAVTIRHLMSHSAGFRTPTWPWGGDKPWHPFEPHEWSQIVAMLPYTEVEFTPGSRYQYSNLGVVFLGRIIEKLSGDDYEVYIDKNILKPLGMYASYFDHAPYHLLARRSASYFLSDGKLTEAPFDFDTGITVSNGGLNAPLADMTKYMRFLTGGAAPEILKRSSLEEMWKPQVKVADPPNPESNDPDNRDSAALSFFVREQGGQRFIGHYGFQNGFDSHFHVQPETRSGYIVVFNTEATGKNTNTRRLDNELRDWLFAHFFGHAK